MSVKRILLVIELHASLPATFLARAAYNQCTPARLSQVSRWVVARAPCDPAHEGFGEMF